MPEPCCSARAASGSGARAAAAAASHARRCSRGAGGASLRAASSAGRHAAAMVLDRAGLRLGRSVVGPSCSAAAAIFALMQARSQARTQCEFCGVRSQTLQRRWRRRHGVVGTAQRRASTMPASWAQCSSALPPSHSQEHRGQRSCSSINREEYTQRVINSRSHHQRGHQKRISKSHGFAFRAAKGCC